MAPKPKPRQEPELERLSSQVVELQKKLHDMQLKLDETSLLRSYLFFRFFVKVAVLDMGEPISPGDGDAAPAACRQPATSWPLAGGRHGGVVR